jgi:phage-related protein
MAEFKSVTFLGDVKQRLRDFPDGARSDAGQELLRLQFGREPLDWKPMPSIGKGVREIRVSDRPGEFRVIYVANIGATIYVLHAFHKKTQKTQQRDLELAKARLKLIVMEN